MKLGVLVKGLHTLSNLSWPHFRKLQQSQHLHGRARSQSVLHEGQFHRHPMLLQKNSELASVYLRTGCNCARNTIQKQANCERKRSPVDNLPVILIKTSLSLSSWGARVPSTIWPFLSPWKVLNSGEIILEGDIPSLIWRTEDVRTIFSSQIDEFKSGKVVEWWECWSWYSRANIKNWA